MASRYSDFRWERLHVKLLRYRKGDRTTVDDIVPPPHQPLPMVGKTAGTELANLAFAISSAFKRRAPVILFIGGHTVKAGMNEMINMLIQERIVTHVACNGAALLHDWELAYHGSTSEHVPEAMERGEFGMWDYKELHDTITQAYAMQCGLGERIGHRMVDPTLHDDEYPYWVTSIFHTGAEFRCPVTVHPLLGGDVFQMRMSPELMGQFAEVCHKDWMIFTEAVQRMTYMGGVFLNIGSAVTGPEVFLKSLSMVRNANMDKNLVPFTTGVIDMQPIPENWREAELDENDPAYYNRFLKTILRRTVAGGNSYYVQDDLRQALPALLQQIRIHRNDDSDRTATRRPDAGPADAAGD